MANPLSAENLALKEAAMDARKAALSFVREIHDTLPASIQEHSDKIVLLGLLSAAKQLFARLDRLDAQFIIERLVAIISIEREQDICRAHVPGNPAPQGSKRHVGGGVLVESSKAVAPWRADVRAGLLEPEGMPKATFENRAVAVHLEFALRRPKSTPKRKTPPAIKRPDLDKLVRAVLDAIGSAGVWRDDSQVIFLTAMKRLVEFEEAPGCRIVIDDCEVQRIAA